ncbi:hypothetical protein Athai_46570 [Actinocatenispora thailandica]|uniref:MmpS family membrane protein n=1 Tax=Actinocatenispora thailandica TaxID=227318 RepID=A0A7R7DSQ7_9ACTN|nr:MmpS family transport accessory protein [Actinocatenispora thailandica]BCJ37154.1 hypothetical protein Athai_46570 [Actinocatenispora thailandica]
MRNKLLTAIPLALLAVTAIACSGSGTGTTKGPGAEDGTPAASGQGTPATKHGSSETKHRKSGHTIVFKVTGNGVSKANDITYGIGANQSQDNGAALPWTKKSHTDDSVLLLGLTAQSDGTSGSITCSISVDGKVAVTNTSRGQYAVVTCNKDM